MTRLRKLLVACMMVLVTCCASIGSAISNIAQSIFSWVKASASSSSSYDYSNKHEESEYVEGDIVTVTGLGSKTTVGGNSQNPFKIPSKIQIGSVGNASVSTVEAKVIIKNPYGVALLDDAGSPKDAQLTAKDAEGNYTFKPNQAGTYTVQYAYEKVFNAGLTNEYSVWTVTKEYTIVVTSEKYTIEFVTNDSIVMPDKMDTNDGVETTITIKLPKFYNKENGKLIDQFILGDDINGTYYVASYEKLENVYLKDNVPVAYEANKFDEEGKHVDDGEFYNIYDEYYAYKITKTTDVTGIEYALVIDAEGKTNVNNDNSNQNLLILNEQNFSGNEAYYNAVAYTFEADDGLNTVNYQLCDNVLGNLNSPYAYTTLEIDGTTAYDSSKIELGATTSKKVKSSETSIGEKTYLPEVKASNKNDSSDNNHYAHYSYVVKFVDTTASTDKYSTNKDKVKLGVDENGVYFIPQAKGTYNISYNAKDFYGNIDENADTYDYDVNVTDRTSPSLYYVDSYNFETIDIEKVEDYSYVIPTQFELNTTEGSYKEITIPAIYTKDNYKTFAELDIKRTISTEDGFVDKDGKAYNLVIQNEDGETKFVSTTGSISKDSIEVKVSGQNDPLTISVNDIVKFVNPNYTITNNEFYAIGSADKLTGTELVKAKTSSVAIITLNPNIFKEEKYSVEFYTSDGVYSNKSGQNTFTFELINKTANKIDNKAPTVSFGTISLDEVTADTKISIAKPEISDNVDKNLYVKYYVVANGEYLEIKLDENNKLTFNTSKEVITGKSIYDLAVESAEKNFKVVAIAFDDFANASFIADPTTVDLVAPASNIGVATYTIPVSYDDDDKAPVVTAVSELFVCEDCDHVQHNNLKCEECEGVNFVTGYNENNENKQYSEIIAHGVKFYDNTSNITAKDIKISVINSQGVECGYEELEGSYMARKVDSAPVGLDASYVYEYYFAGVKFTAGKADNYTVTYNISNGQQHVTYTYVIRTTTDAEAPNISILGTTKTIELGTTHYFQDIKVTDNSAGNITLKASVKDANGKAYNFYNETNKSFTPNKPGTYTVTFEAVDAEGNVSDAKSAVIVVKDTIKPEIELIDSDKEVIKVEEQEGVNWKEDGYPEIALPGFAVSDAYSELTNPKGTITITTPKGVSYTMDQNGVLNVPEDRNDIKLRWDSVTPGVESNYKFFFTPEQRGCYTVSYIATDSSNNKSEEKTIPVYVGDTEKPTIHLTSDLTKLLNRGFVVGENDQLVIDTKARIYGDNGYDSQDLYVKDNWGFETETDGNNNEYKIVSVSIKNSNGKAEGYTKESENGLVSYTFTTKGTYTITFTVEDSVGNESLAKTINFTVSAKSTNSVDTAQILGTVLIVVSIAILAGVVIYFVRGTKLLPKKSKKKANKEDKKETKKD